MRPTLAIEAEQITDPGAVRRRLGAEQPRTNVPGSIQPAARPSGSDGGRPGPADVGDRRSCSRSTVSSPALLSAGRPRRRRDAELLLVVRRAEQGRGFLTGGRDARSRS
jgi:hypothetical protein